MLLISFCLLGIFPVLPAQEKEDAVYLPPVEFDYSYRSEVYAVIIDARVARDYRRNRISGALGIENTDKLSAFADTMDTETPLYIYCDVESRSRTVAAILAGRGFSRLYILKGGTREWEAAGLPLDEKRRRRRR